VELFRHWVDRHAEAVDLSEVVDGELVPCHGDFSPQNVLVGPGGFALIDWDKLQLADPARDIAYTRAWCWAEAIRHQR
jgi:aminoglycoside phosphotransferase (APT) family kinase protein